MQSHEIVVGWTNEAAIFAIRNNIPLLASSKHFYHIDDFLGNYCFEEFGFQNTGRKLFVDNEFIVTGQSCRALQRALFWLLSMNGLLRVGEIKRTYDNKFLVGGETIKYDTAFVFCPNSVEGLMHANTKRLFKVNDMFDAIDTSMQPHDGLTNSDEFVNSVWFPASRKGTSRNLVKEFHAISFLTEEELKSADFSHRMARYKLRDFLTKKGIRGRRDKVVNGKTYYKKVKLSFIDRVVTEVTDYKKELPGDMLNCSNMSMEEALKQQQKPSFLNNSFLYSIANAKISRKI